MSLLALVTTPSAVFQFEAAHASVIFKNESVPATGKQHQSLEVMAIDAYGYQREWSLKYTWEPGNTSKLCWLSHVYQHPGRREVHVVDEKQAAGCILKFLELCRDFPSLLFNDPSISRPRSAGFVQFCERLHRGELPSKTMF